MIPPEQTFGPSSFSDAADWVDGVVANRRRRLAAGRTAGRRAKQAEDVNHFDIQPQTQWPSQT